MKDIDKLLAQHAPKPARALRATFTEATLGFIAGREPARGLHRLRDKLRARLLTRAGVVSFSGVLLLSGTVAALALWPSPSVTQTTTKLLPSGNHIVGYDAKNCNFFDELHGAANVPTDDKVYYEVRAGSSLTDEQLRNSLQGACEENMSNNAMTSIIKQLPDARGMQTTIAYVVNAVTPSSITISPDPHYNAADYTTKPTVTFTHFADHLIVRNESARASYGDIKPGDTIKLAIQDTSNHSSEEQSSYNAMNHPEHVIVLAIEKIPALTANPDTFYSAIATDIVRLNPCSVSPTGFCRAYDFAH